MRSKNRKAILKSLESRTKTQAELHKITKMYRTHVRRSLNELIDKRLVVCLNPKDRIFKLYEITQKGKRILKKVDEIKKVNSN